jgi:hypothetical protein
MRNIPNQMCLERRMVKNGDKFFTSILGHYGKSHYHSEIEPAVYRAHDGGTWSSISKQEKTEEHLNTFFWIYKYYKRINEVTYAKYYWKLYVRMLLSRVDLTELSREFLIRILLIRKQKNFLKRCSSAISLK